MAAVRFQTNGNNFILLAAGVSYYSYGDVTENFWDDDGYVSYSETGSSTGVAGASGWEPSLLLQITFGGGSAEVGLNGPDIYVGAGFVF
jgi:hypothetical protein